jgi:hypothetical protein
MWRIILWKFVLLPQMLVDGGSGGCTLWGIPFEIMYRISVPCPSRAWCKGGGIISKCLFQIAQRSLPFLHNCIKDLDILEISAQPGAVACWVFLCCLEVLQTCEHFSDSIQIEAYSRYTASLWAYARDKVRVTNVPCVWVCMLAHSSSFTLKHNGGILNLVTEILLNHDISRSTCNSLC